MRFLPSPADFSLRSPATCCFMSSRRTTAIASRAWRERISPLRRAWFQTGSVVCAPGKEQAVRTNRSTSRRPVIWAKSSSFSAAQYPTQQSQDGRSRYPEIGAPALCRSLSRGVPVSLQRPLRPEVHIPATGVRPHEGSPVPYANIRIVYEASTSGIYGKGSG
jgi:hypothetical protein